MLLVAVWISLIFVLNEVGFLVLVGIGVEVLVGIGVGVLVVGGFGMFGRFVAVLDYFCGPRNIEW